MILGLDISTSCIGYCLFDDKGSKLLELNYVKFNRKLDLFEKLDEFLEKIKHLSLMKIDHIAIEEPLKKFKSKYSSADTIALLNFFNGMVSSAVYKLFNKKPVHYNVRVARSTAFPEFKEFRGEGESNKHEIWSLVNKREPHIMWKYGPKNRKLVDENYDMSDSYICALCHINLLKKQNLI